MNNIRLVYMLVGDDETMYRVRLTDDAQRVWLETALGLALDPKIAAICAWELDTPSVPPIWFWDRATGGNVFKIKAMSFGINARGKA